ncbi:MAG TPA: hypothetical protein VMS96_06970 [Terriglobales bacterium]|nr:hypothetical protein [Terriglobales bacterium]
MKLTKPTREQVNAAVQAQLHGLLPTCPACGRTLAGHRWAILASDIAEPSTKERLKTLFGLFKAHEWAELSKTKQFDPAKNALEFFALLCNSGGVVSAVRNPFELLEPHELLAVETINSMESTEIERLVDDWQEFHA